MANEFKIKKGLIVTGASGGTVVDIQGSQGQLFSVTDDLSGSIFAVSDISGVPILDVNSSGVSYFDGSLGIGTANPSRQLEVVSSSGIVTVLTSTTGGSYISMEDSATTSDSQVRFGAIGNNAIIKSGGTTALSLDTSQNATFAGTVTAPTFLGDLNGTINTATTGTTQTAGNNSTLIATTAYADAAAGAVPIGNYLPLSAGSGFPLTDSLYIGSSGANGLILKQDTSAGSNSGRLFFQTDTTIEGVCIMNANGTLTFRTSSDPGATSGNTKMVLTNSGNVGIGTTSPSQKLEVSGNIHLTNKADSILLGSAGANGTWGAPKISRIDNSIIISDYSGVQLGGYDGSSYGARVTIKGTGNVGIGTTSPETKLTIENASAGPASSTYATTASNANLHLSAVGVPFYNHLFMGVGSATYAWIQAQHGNSVTQNLALNPIGGNVGIGTTSPSTLLEISGNSQASTPALRINCTDSSVQLNQVAGAVQFSVNDASTPGAGVKTSINSIALNSIGSRYGLGFNTTSGVNNVERMRIDQDGNVGIGTDTPLAPLSVVAASSADQELAQKWQYTSSDNYNLELKQTVTLGVVRWTFDQKNNGTAYPNVMTLDRGKVGIGTTSPSTDLQVIGTVRADVFGVQDDSTNPSGNTSTRVTSPAGATYDDQNNSASTGVLSVILPTTAPSTMLSFTLRVFDYANNESFDVNVAGYWYGSGLWANTSVRIESQGNVERNFNVRFGKNNTTNKGWVGVGETTTNWSYVKFAVLNFQAAHVNDDLERWNDLWDTAVLTSLTGYTTLVTKNNNQVNNWARNGENLYYGSGSGNVGIGTTSPGVKMDVEVDSASAGDLLRLTNSNTGGGSKRSAMIYRLTDSVGTRKDAGYIRVQGTNNNITTGASMEFWTRKGNSNPTESMRISTNGNVGIGTASPGFKLDVSGDGIRNIRSTAGWAGWFENTASSSGVVITAGVDSGDAPLLVRKQNGTEIFSVRGNGVSWFNGGNVGIGTTSPDYLLDLSKTAVSVDTYSGINLQASNYGYTIEGGITQNVGGELIFSSNNAGTRNPRVKFAANGNVGIGTTTPLAKLDIQGTQGQLFSVTDDLSGSIFAVADISGVPIFDVNSSGVSYFDGEVNIGRGTNFYTLNVGATSSGSIYTDGRIFGGGDFYVAGEAIFNGNVGIGTTSPQTKLHVSGGSSIETTLIVGAEGTGNDKSARVFLNEGEGGVTNSKDYGFSLAYDGQGAQYGGLSANQFGILRHNNSATGAAVMVMNRTNNNTTFTGTVTATNFILSSDERLKENIEKACDNRIKADWKTFELKTDKGQKRYGVIAQELEKTNPEFVREDTQGFKSVAYIDLLIAKIAELEARLEKAGI